jgi:hypothetical protein
MAPALAGNLRLQGSPEHVLRVLLSGLTDPIDSRSYAAGVMVPQKQQNDEWIAAVASYIRNGMTNGANMVTPDMVARIRAAEAGQATPYTDAQLKKIEPRLVAADAAWKVTASHNASVIIGGTGHPAGALNLEGWTTGEPQKPGMWFQIELPRTVNLAGLDYQALISAAFAPVRPAAAAAAAPPAPAPAPAAPAAGIQRPPRLVYFPRGFRVEVSTDGQSWKMVKEGQGSSMYNSLLFDPTPARFVRFTTTAAADVPWGMRYLKLYEKPVG